MSDLISRQALCEYALNQKDKSVTPNDIMRFPSAQPDVPDTNVGDIINRQAAIDILNQYALSLNPDKDSKELWKVKSIKSFIEQLPSAQPERAMKDCRNCKHGNYNDHWGTYFCYHSGDCNDWDKWEPSAQPEPLVQKSRTLVNDLVKDTVSRQAAIEAIERAKTVRSQDGEIYVAKLNAEMNIQILPPAQPEIVRCHKCIYWDRDTVRQNSNDAGWWNEAVCKRYSDEIWTSWKDADWYCADAERKDDE